eukprot:TRINITY_DN693_c0_g1_i2.p1 TRINITY_DN693_c0_g1~~TRINITY_DN693_c0_g1_i2.p1  ORF type:complete len:635 (-),score=95.57 TRINITY_DN693_c0_g1_i2:330-2234(-)
MADSGSNTQIAAVKRLLHAQLQGPEVRLKLRDVISSLPLEGNLDEASVLQGIRQQDLIGTLLNFMVNPVAPAAQPVSNDSVSGASRTPSIAPADVSEMTPPVVPILPRSNSSFLHVRLIAGRSFNDFLPSPAEGCPSLIVELLLDGKRTRSAPVPACSEPRFSQSFLLDLQQPLDVEDLGARLLKLDTPLHIVILKHDEQRGGGCTLIGTHCLDWRRVLQSGTLTIAVEMAGIGVESSVPAGTLDIQLELLPHAVHLPVADVMSTITRQKAYDSECARRFVVYARNWWRDYLHLRESHKTRLIKIFATTEAGQQKCVCTYVRPIRSSRLIESARHAARFVALIPRVGSELIGGGRTDVWQTPHATLAACAGDLEDHAVLLCSLLLGLGLDAYVCVGSTTEGYSVWVMSRSEDGVVFWDVLQGARYAIQKGMPHPFRFVDCIFNNVALYANVQVDNTVTATNYDLNNASLWKAMDRDVLALLKPCAKMTLRECTLQVGPLEEEIESALATCIEEYRVTKGLDTQWDSDLSHVLSPALSAYELERLAGVTTGTSDFAAAIRATVPSGFTFKGFPVQFVHRVPRKMFASMIRSQACAAIVNAQGAQLRFALRTKVYGYAENLTATWVMLAATVRDIE